MEVYKLIWVTTQEVMPLEDGAWELKSVEIGEDHWGVVKSEQFEKNIANQLFQSHFNVFFQRNAALLEQFF